jgi:hypothetical protein
MFVTKTRFENTVELLESEIRDLGQRYYSLLEKYRRLMIYLDIYEKNYPPRTTIKKKKDKE